MEREWWNLSLHRFLRRTGQANVGNKLYMNPNRTAGKPISISPPIRMGGGRRRKRGGMWRGKLLFQRMTLLVGNVSFTPFEEINSPTSYDFSTAIENISLCYHIMMLRFPNLTTSISCPIQNDNTFLIKYSISILQDMSWINYDNELKEGIASRSHETHRSPKFPVQYRMTAFFLIKYS